MTFEELKALIQSAIPGSIQDEVPGSTPPMIQLNPHHLQEVCQLLHSHEKTFFDMLSCLTGIDNGTEVETMEVIYHLYSIPYNLQLALKVILPRSKPQIDSVSDIWRTANWHEREAFDLLGINFKGHPDQRRILLPSDWEGHPLRKDYTEQDTYHGMSVIYDRNEDADSLK